MGPSITIVGGGLAGMTAARELLAKGCEVTIYEASERLGGKAGASAHGTDYDEHGWHLFPLWYLNIWRLVDELGIRDSFVDQTKYAYLRAGSYPRTTWLDSPFSFSSAFHNLFHGVLPPAICFLYQYALLDLMSQPVRRRAELDQVTVCGFVRGKFYGIDSVIEGLQDTISRASAIESFEMSAMTVRNVMRFWFRYHDPWFRVLNGNLQSKFIEPIEMDLRNRGCSIRLNSLVTEVKCRNENIIGITVEDQGTHKTEAIAVSNLLLSVPAYDIRYLLDSNLLNLSTSLGKTYYLRSRIMAGMTIYFKKKIVGIPKGHTNFVDNIYELSIIDVTDLWGIKDRTIICVVASDYTTLQAYSVDEATQLLLKELQRYLPFVRAEDIERINLQPHVKQPLFANTAGAWTRRPEAHTEISNLYLAGDYCRTHVDLTCMEGAVCSGLHAANAILKQAGLGEAVKVKVPKTRPRILLVLMKIALFPGALVALAVARLQQRKL